MLRIFAVLLFCAGIFCLAQSHAQVPMTGAGLGAPGGGGGCSQATAYIARLTSSDSTHNTALTTMICGLVTDSTYTSLGGMWVLAQKNSAVNGLLNVTSTSFSLLKTNTVTFTDDQGAAADGITGFLDTQFIPSSSGTVAQDSIAVGVYDRTSGTINQIVFGVTDGVNNLSTNLDFGGNLFARINSAADAACGANAGTQGMWVETRTGPSAVSVYKNSSSTAFCSTATASTGLPTLSVYIGAQNNGGVGGAFDTDQVAVFFIASKLTGAQSASVSTRINTYMTTLGTNVY